MKIWTKLAACVGLFFLVSSGVWAQTASLLPNGQQQFADGNGTPFAGGQVYFYIPNTTTPKATWQDQDRNVANANPVILDAAGRATIYGAGPYREILRDSDGNTIWDQITNGEVISNAFAPVAAAQSLNDARIALGATTIGNAVFTAVDATSAQIALNVPGLNGNGTINSLQGGTPIGAGMDFWGQIAPQGWLFPYGQEVDRTTYAALFAVYGTTYGSGDGVTTFNLPDMRGRVAFGKDNMGGTSANRLTASTSQGIDGSVLGATGGEQAHTQTIGELVPHTHNMPSYPLLAGTGYAAGSFNALTQGPTAPTTSSGLGNPFNIVPPGIICNYIVFAGV